jgi:tetratricopeptide (TPR) repeat protein
VSKEKGPESKSLADDLPEDAPPQTNNQNDGGTRVDLGEDLLEKTAMLRLPYASRTQITPPEEPEPTLVESPITADQIQDQIQSARILMGEGILEEAKRVLRRILLFATGEIEAKQLLEEIHEIELKQIFGEAENPRRRIRRRREPEAAEVRADSVMRELDRDLRLGLFAEDGSDSAAIELSLFEDRRALDIFGDKMDRDFAASPASERLDLGIAFMEMGLYSLAVRHFYAAMHRLRFEGPESQALLISATGLLGNALILGGRAFDATLAMQTVLSDSEVVAENKLDLMYLMGRANQALGKDQLAAQWYHQAAEIDPHYRDIQERLRSLSPGRG